MLGCDYVEYQDLLGGLTPSFSLAHCISVGDEPPDKDIFKEKHLFEYTTLVVFYEGEFRYIYDRDDLRALYAPIETSEEALSYALAGSMFSAIFDYRLDSSLQYLQDTIENTHVLENDDGYLVHLFGGWVQNRGCGTHTNWTTDVLVSRDGQIKFTNHTPFAEFNGCVD
jgi:hypothetical protein